MWWDCNFVGKDRVIAEGSLHEVEMNVVEIFSGSCFGGRGEDVSKLRMVRGIVDYEVVTSIEGARGKAKIQRGFCCVTVSHEEACCAFGGEFLFVVFNDITYSTKNVEIFEVGTFLVDDEVR